jgi:hypothetical protein
MITTSIIGIYPDCTVSKLHFSSLETSALCNFESGVTRKFVTLHTYELRTVLDSFFSVRQTKKCQINTKCIKLEYQQLRLPAFSRYGIPKISNKHKMYQIGMKYVYHMDIKLPKGHEICIPKNFHSKVFQSKQKWYFWFENIPSGNHAAEYYVL